MTKYDHKLPFMTKYDTKNAQNSQINIPPLGNKMYFYSPLLFVLVLIIVGHPQEVSLKVS